MIQVKGLTKVFKIQHRRPGLRGTLQDLFSLRESDKIALENVDFIINPGEIVGCIGPNGAGKSTTIKILTGVLLPTSGQVTINGRIPWKERNAHLREIGVMFGSRGAIWQELPAIDSFNLLAEMYGVHRNQYRKNLDFLSEILGIGSFLNRPVRELSLGQRMRCELASVFLHSPRVVFLDEPTIGLDTQVKQKIRELIHFYNREEAMTVIYTSHDLHEVEEICPRLIIINQGRMIYDGQTAILKSKQPSLRRIRLKAQNEKFLSSLTDCLEEMQRVTGDFKVETVDVETLLIKFDPTTFKIPVFLSQIGQRYDWIQDIVIEDSSMEDIITRLYSETTLGGGMGVV